MIYQPDAKLLRKREGVKNMTKKYNKGSRNQSSPEAGHNQMEIALENSGDNSKGNVRGKSQNTKTK
jgi:hypothetical protein